ncbi:hypothetical protein OEZ66_35195, partial [Escherichia coli]|nr:hypothetical protein [Escherichia coli]
HNRYTRVGSTQVDTNNFTHLNVSTLYSVIMWYESVIGAKLTVSTYPIRFFADSLMRLTTRWGRNPRHQGGEQKNFCLFAYKNDVSQQNAFCTVID